MTGYSKEKQLTRLRCEIKQVIFHLGFGSYFYRQIRVTVLRAETRVLPQTPCR